MAPSLHAVRYRGVSNRPHFRICSPMPLTARNTTPKLTMHGVAKPVTLDVAGRDVRVLQVISSSPGELRQVFESMLKNAVRICGAKFGSLRRREGNSFRIAATHDAPPAYSDYRRREPYFHPSLSALNHHHIAVMCGRAQKVGFSVTLPCFYRSPCVWRVLCLRWLRRGECRAQRVCEGIGALCWRRPLIVADESP
jgi:hypothetical protein